MTEEEQRLPIIDTETVGKDPRWTLVEWSLFISEQTEKYGPRSILSAISEDTWHSVNLVLEKRK